MTEPWDGSGAIVGPWAGRPSAEQALARALVEVNARRLEHHERDACIARLHEIGGTFWLDVDGRLVPSLAGSLAAPHIFGAEVEYARYGNRAVAVELWQLELVERRTLVRARSLGVEPADHDANDAVFLAELRGAAQVLGVPPEVASTEMIFYRSED